MKNSTILLLMVAVMFLYAGSASAAFDTFYGAAAGDNSTGDYNAFFGRFTGTYNYGDKNTSIGNYSGMLNTGSYNTFNGYYAGYGNEGAGNVFTGYYAGYKNAGGEFNVFTGYKTGYETNSGDANVFTGYVAGYSNTYGSYNTFNGYYAGYNNTTGNYNVFTGGNSGRSNTTGYRNTFIGHSAGYKNTEGDSNTYIGKNAAFNNMTGNNNTSVGEDSGYNNTTGGSNAFFGYSAGFHNTEGSSNTYIGVNAAFNNITGNNNTSVGKSAGYNSTGGNNVFLGYNAGYNETGSNRLYIDNSSTNSPLIWGDFSSNVMAINGSLGIGTTTPSSTLTVAGTIQSTSGGIKFPDGTTMTSTSGFNADTLDGQDSTAFAAAAHSHAGADISSGTVGEAYIDAAVARDSELSAHTSRTDNPHGVTAAQVGAADAAHNHDADYMSTSGGTIDGDLLVVGILDVDQDLYVVGNMYLESDAQSKDNIRPIESSLDKISSIRGVTFDWKDRTGDKVSLSKERHYGVIAQEVEEVLPEIVTTGSNGRKKVAYTELIPVLIEAMKEQQNVVENQQKTISALLDKVRELEKEVRMKGSVALNSADM